MSTLLTYLPWVLPPFIGAAIGYITNAIAIAMLFRPYTEKRFFGIKIPLTPGIIPRQRYDLSESIGRLVSRELLTEDAIRGQTGSASFSREMEKTVRSFLETLFTTPLREIKEFLTSSLSGKEFFPSQNSSVSASIITEIINSFLSSKGLSVVIDRLLDKGLSHAGNKTLGEFAAGMSGLAGNAADLVFTERNRKGFVSFLRRAVERGIYRNVKFSSFLSPETIEMVTSFLLKVYEKGFPGFVSWLREPDIKKELELRGRFILEDVLEKLNRVQRFFLSVGQYDRTLEENMGSIIDDVIEQFKNAGTDSENKEKLRGIIQSLLERLSRFSLGEVAAAWGESFTEDVEKGADYAASFIFTSSMGKKFVRGVEAFIKKNESRTVEEILFSWTGITLHEAKEKISFILFGGVDDMAGKRKEWKESYLFSYLVPDLFSALTGGGERSLKEILHLDDNLLEKMGGVSAVMLLEMINARIPEILKSVDVQTLVVKKIDSLDIEKVEELILEVVKKQLRWINLFGALLGALIGGVQIVLNFYAH